MLWHAATHLDEEVHIESLQMLILQVQAHMTGALLLELQL